MNQAYEESGYLVLRRLFAEAEIQALSKAVLAFQDSWKRRNAEFYREKAVNSAYVTGSEHLDESKRRELFGFIGSSRLMKIVSEVIPGQAAFMNTQVFFDPVNTAQKNYWHRDPQYHLSVNEQKEALAGPQVVHFRIPLTNEPGIELVPGTHKRWDTEEELDVRLEKNGHRNHEDISTGVVIKLDAGDLLVFSANMIHRGIYGMNRLSLDILFCDPDPGLIKFASEDCLPAPNAMEHIENPSAFLQTISLKATDPRAMKY